MKKYKVLHICRNVDGGVAVVVERLARQQTNSKYKPIVLFDDKRMSFFRQNIIESKIMVIELENNDVAELRNSNRTVNPLRIGEKIQKYFGSTALDLYLSFKSLLSFIRYDLKKVYSVKRMIKEYGIDIVHSHKDIHFSKLETLACKIARVPFVAHVHGFGLKTSFDKFFNLFIDSFIYISRDVETHHVKHGNRTSKGIVIHNGVDIKKCYNKKEGNDVKKSLGLKNEDFVIGIIGRIDWWKGHLYFIEAIERATRKIPNIKGLIIGELEQSITAVENKAYYNDIKKLIRTLKLEDKIIFTGFEKNVDKILTAIDVVVHASTHPEPFGLVIIEGMAAAKPVIATAAGGVPEIIDHNSNGILVPPKDSQAISRAIIKLAENRDKAKSIGNAARDHVKINFSTKNQKDRIEDVYDKNLSQYSKAT